MIVAPRCFSAEVLRRGLRTLITSNVIWIKSRSTAVRHHMCANHFLSVVLQCHVVRCHSFDVCRTHHWKLRCIPRWADMSKTSRIRSSTRAPQSSTSQSDWSGSQFTVYRRFLLSSNKISTIPHLRIQSCSLEMNLAAVVDVFDVQVSSTCLLLSLSLILVTLDFDFPVPFPLP